MRLIMAYYIEIPTPYVATITLLSFSSIQHMVLVYYLKNCKLTIMVAIFSILIQWLSLYWVSLCPFYQQLLSHLKTWTSKDAKILSNYRKTLLSGCFFYQKYCSFLYMHIKKLNRKIKKGELKVIFLLFLFMRLNFSGIFVVCLKPLQKGWTKIRTERMSVLIWI